MNRPPKSHPNERRTSRGIALLLAASIGSGAIGGCSSAQDTVDTRTSWGVATYEGKDLYCIVQQGAATYRSYDCDFSRYHAGQKPPENAPRIEEGKLEPVTIPYGDQTIRCLAFQTTATYYGTTCDFVKLQQDTSVTNTTPVSPPSTTK